MEGKCSVSQPKDQRNSSNTSGTPDPKETWKNRYIEQKTARAEQANLPVIPPAKKTKAAAAATGSAKKKVHWWRWVALGLAVVLVGFGIFTYIRVSSFLDNSFNG